jgi:hypothetical protein
MKIINRILPFNQCYEGNKKCDILGYRSGAVEVFVLLECGAVSLDE